MKSHALIITCEHAMNTIPPAFADLFNHDRDVLFTHRGIDIGALAIANHLAETLPCDYYQAATLSRLVIDCNRSLKNAQCFSEWTNTLSKNEKHAIIDTYYHPYRRPAIQKIEQFIAQGKRIIHLSIHSFTPVLNGVKREADIGLLYDPKRDNEKKFARAWQEAFAKTEPQYRVRMNYPYRGTSDGFTTALRKQFSAQEYVGLEVESNQALMKPLSVQHELIHAITSTLLKILP